MKLRWLISLVGLHRITDEEFTLANERITASGGDKRTILRVEEHINSIEAKSGVLLTHVSMMIAITGLMLAVGEKAFLFELALAMELIAYLLLALLCIRCQFQFDATDFGNAKKEASLEKTGAANKYQRTMFAELYYRESLFRFVHRALYGLTFVLIGTVIWGLFSDDIGRTSGSIVQETTITTLGDPEISQ